MEARSPSHLPWWPLPVLVACSLLVFWPVLGLTAFSDDHSALWNSGVRGIPWRNGFFRPLSDHTFHVIHLLGGTSPLEQRLFNVALHGANAFLVFAFYLRYIDRPSSRHIAAWLATLLFILYPFHQESIVWLVGRESSLGTFFTLLGLLFLNSAVHPWRRVVLACAAMFIGALCYESALLLPVLIIPLARSGMISQPIPERSLSIGLAAVTLLYAALWVLQGDPSVGSYFGQFLNKEPMGFLTNIPKVCARLFLPPMDPTFMAPATGALFVALTVVMTVAWRSMRNDEEGRRNLSFLALLLLFTCAVPVLGSVSTRTSESDRFLYMPSAFLCIIVALLVTRLAHRGIMGAVVVFLFVGCGLLLRKNHHNWERASATTEQILIQLPAPPLKGRVFISGLPDAHHGAFIFRNGFREAVHLSGRPGDRYIPVGMPGPNDPAIYRDEALHPGPEDRWWVWRDGSFRLHETVP